MTSISKYGLQGMKVKLDQPNDVAERSALRKAQTRYRKQTFRQSTFVKRTKAEWQKEERESKEWDALINETNGFADAIEAFRALNRAKTLQAQDRVQRFIRSWVEEPNGTHLTYLGLKIVSDD